jgi:hypothetical protein
LLEELDRIDYELGRDESARQARLNQPEKPEPQRRSRTRDLAWLAAMSVLCFLWQRDHNDLIDVIDRERKDAEVRHKEYETTTESMRSAIRSNETLVKMYQHFFDAQQRQLDKLKEEPTSTE